MDRVVGLVGIGSVGLLIAKLLRAAGLDVIGYRRTNADDFLGLGGTLAGSAAEVFDRARIVFTCVPDGDALEDVVSGPGGLLTSKANGRIVIETSTTALVQRERLREALGAAGSTLIDCPVSGVTFVIAARKGVFLASGERAAFDEIEPYLRILTEEVVYAGPFGAGTKIKYLANYLMVSNFVAAAEAVALAQECGLDAAKAVEILAKGAGGSVQLAQRGPDMAAGKYRPAPATLGPLMKDIELIRDFAAQFGLPNGLFERASQIVAQTIALGYGDAGPAAAIEAVRAAIRASPT